MYLRNIYVVPIRIRSMTPLKWMDDTRIEDMPETIFHAYEPDKFKPIDGN